MSKKTRIIVIVVSIIVVAFIVGCGIDYFVCRNRVPSKNERINNMMIYRGSTNITDEDIMNDIESVLSKYSNWDNLFLSDQFKAKYKNRNDFIDDAWKISKISSGIDETKDSQIIIYAEHKVPFWDGDESDNIATRYVFKYYRNAEGQLDDLELVDKRDVYIINGEPIS